MVRFILVGICVGLVSYYSLLFVGSVTETSALILVIVSSSSVGGICFLFYSAQQKKNKEYIEQICTQIKLSEDIASCQLFDPEINKEINIQLKELAKFVHTTQKEKEIAIKENINKTNYVAHMSHEIRTPLNGIIGIVQILTTTDINELQFNYLETIKSSGDHLLNLVNDILSYSKLQNSEVQIEHKTMSLHKCIQQSMSLFLTKINREKVQLKADIHPDVPELINSDITKIRQIFFNLLGNAVKFTAEGHIILKVDRKESTGSILVLMFQVIDSGIGIPPDKQQLIFEPYKQADASVEKNYGGTGLGLSLTKQLIQAMGGKMELKSEVGKGSNFYFTLKCKDTTPQEAQIFNSLTRRFPRK